MPDITGIKMRSVTLSAIYTVSFLTVCFGQELDNEQRDQWELFKVYYGKIYESQNEEEYRRTVFLKNQEIISSHNKLYEEGKTTFTMKLNKFADMSSAEFKSFMNGYKMSPRNYPEFAYKVQENEELPKSVDWRTKGAVTPVKNQAQCGSCWAFSATGSLEGQTFLKTGKLVSLSEQNLMDCSWEEGNHGCEGGLMDLAFEYIKSNKGIDTEDSYPYEGKDGVCKFNASNIGATLSSYIDIKSGSEDSLQSAVANVGPISVGIDAGKSSFQFYSSGIYYEPRCSSRTLDHGVLAVGYGSNSQGDFWIVKNSWGEDWGDQGYLLMARNRNNNCGIATRASYPVL